MKTLRAATLLIAAAAFSSLALAALSSSTASATSLEGSWRGSGYIKFSSGAKERVRCRASYQKQTPKVFRVSATCATSSAKVTQIGTLSKVRNGRFVGSFYNPEFDVSGRVRVTVRGSSQSVTLSSGQASGHLKLRKR